VLERVCVLEVRADLTGEIEREWIAGRFAGSTLYTLRSRDEGGRAEGDGEARWRRLAAAGASWDLVDLELDRDLTPAVLEAVPPERRVLSWHGDAADLETLHALVERMDRTGARYSKLVPAAQRSGQELAPLDLLFDLKRDDVTAFATGEIGAWTRVLAPALGAPLVFGSLGSAPAAPGQPTIDRLVRDYGLPRPLRPSRLCGIVGRPVGHSLSPRLHNGAYRHLGIDALYLAFHAESFGEFWIEVLESGRFEEWGMPLQGLSVTAPYKEAALALAGASSPRAQAIGGANTLVLERGVWEAESTDPEGVIEPLARRGLVLSGSRAAVLGCGGAGRAAAVGLERAGFEVTLFNRGRTRLRRAAADLGLEAGEWESFEPGDYDVVVHATALGHAVDDPLPFEPARLAPRSVVVDMVYDAHETPLIAAARAAGRRVVTGREVLMGQALKQFQAMNDRELPRELAAELLGLDLAELGPNPAETPS
jgi:3-dehydroquinate dehydratase/shikimate dehydrogenase